MLQARAQRCVPLRPLRLVFAERRKYTAEEAEARSAAKPQPNEKGKTFLAKDAKIAKKILSGKQDPTGLLNRGRSI